MRSQPRPGGIDGDVRGLARQDREQGINQVDRHQHPDRHRDEEKQDFALGVEQGEEHHRGHDGPGGADHGNGRVGLDAAVDQNPCQRTDDGRAQVKGQEIATAVERLHLASDDPEEQHVAQQVPRPGV